MIEKIDSNKELLSSEEVMSLLHIKRASFQEYLKKGILKGYKCGGRRVFCKKSEIMESLKPMQQGN